MSTKRTVLVQESLCILLNCSRDRPWKIKAKHLDNLSLRMQYSGYQMKFRYEVIDGAYKAYKTLLGKKNCW